MSWRISGALVGFILMLSAGHAVAQDRPVTVDVQTWSGLAIHVTQPSFAVLYTVIPTPLLDQTGMPATATPGAAAMPPGLTPGATPEGPMGGPPSGGGMTPSIGGFGGAQQPTQQRRAPEPMRVERPADALILDRGEAMIKVPFDQLASLTVVRAALANSPLPPWAAVHHARSSATAVLTDGTTVSADYFNPGTVLLRGNTAGGRVEIPIEDIAAMKFSR